MQEDQVVVVHIGDLIAGRYRVTEVSPDAINAVDEERTPSPMENPGGAQSATMTASRGPLPSGAPAAPPSEQGGAPLGFVQEANGEVQTVVADGSGVSLVPQAPATALVQATPPAQTTLEASTLPGPVGPKAERPKVKPPARPDLSNRNPRKAVDEAPTFIFQTLGSVETQDGDKRAVVADGSEVYLVKQREVFADQYQVTSVDAVLVLAIRVPQRQTLSTLPAQAESGRQVASKKLNEQTQFPLFDWANYPGAHQAGALANPLLTNLGADPFGVSPAGSGTQLQFFTADSPNVGF